jgi:hypothetical protein
VVAFQVDDIDQATASGWSVMAIGVAEEMTDPDEVVSTKQLVLHPVAAGDRRHFVKIRPEFISGRRII